MRIFIVVLVMAVAGTCVAGAADTGAILKSLEKILREKLSEKTTGKLGDLSGMLGKGIAASLIDIDMPNETVAFSPMFMKLVAYTAGQHLTSIKKFDIDPKDDRLGFDMEFAGGSKVVMDFVPQLIELDVQEFSIVGLVPGGIKLTQPEAVTTGISGYLDAFLGVSEKLGKLMQSVKVDGDTVRLTRPYQASVLGRAMRPDSAGTASVSRQLPFKMEKGWLKMSFQGAGFKSDIWQLALKMLTEKFK